MSIVRNSRNYNTLSFGKGPLSGLIWLQRDTNSLGPFRRGRPQSVVRRVCLPPLTHRLCCLVVYNAEKCTECRNPVILKRRPNLRLQARDDTTRQCTLWHRQMFERIREQCEQCRTQKKGHEYFSLLLLMLFCAGMGTTEPLKQPCERTVDSQNTKPVLPECQTQSLLMYQSNLKRKCTVILLTSDKELGYACRSSGFHSCDYEECRLQGYGVVWVL
jgi:hypothetical protein